MISSGAFSGVSSVMRVRRPTGIMGDASDEDGGGKSPRSKGDEVVDAEVDAGADAG
jgi:hypothetical protein